MLISKSEDDFYRRLFLALPIVLITKIFAKEKSVLKNLSAFNSTHGQNRFIKKLIQAMLICCFVFSFVTPAQSGTLDPTFGNGGVFVSPNDLQGFMSKILIQPDGKILAAGITSANSQPIVHKGLLFRLNSNGTIDASFGVNGKVITELGAFGKQRQSS